MDAIERAEHIGGVRGALPRAWLGFSLRLASLPITIGTRAAPSFPTLFPPFLSVHFLQAFLFPFALISNAREANLTATPDAI